MNSVNKYITEMTPVRNEWAMSLEEYAAEYGVPIMEKDSMNFLTQLIRMHKPSSILEIGTAIGYSALRMHEVHPMTTITTLEKNEQMYEAAVKNIKAANKSEYIKIIHGDARETIDQLVAKNATFDFIFIDAAKGQYERFFKAVQPLIQPEGIIVCDNILFKGYVADGDKQDNVRFQKLANKIRSFNKWLLEQTDYHTSIIPIGDGVSVSVKIT